MFPIFNQSICTDISEQTVTAPISSLILGYTFYHSIATLTLCILIDFLIHINTLNMELPIMYLKGLQVEFSKV